MHKSLKLRTKIKGRRGSGTRVLDPSVGNECWYKLAAISQYSDFKTTNKNATFALTLLLFTSRHG